MLTVRQRYRRTDRQTDGRTTYDSNTALALRASRGKNTQTDRGKTHNLLRSAEVNMQMNVTVFTAWCTYSEKRGIAIVTCPSVCPTFCLSVTLTYRGHIGWVTSKVIARIINLGSSLLGAPTSKYSSRGTPPKFGWNGGGVAIISRKPKISLKRGKVAKMVNGQCYSTNEANFIH